MRERARIGMTTRDDCSGHRTTTARPIAICRQPTHTITSLCCGPGQSKSGICLRLRPACCNHLSSLAPRLHPNCAHGALLEIYGVDLSMSSARRDGHGPDGSRGICIRPTPTGPCQRAITAPLLLLLLMLLLVLVAIPLA